MAKKNKGKPKPIGPTREARYQKRRAAVDAVRAGDSVATVARVLQTSARAIFKWLERYRHGGYDALREGQRSGRRRKVDAELLRWLYEAITQHDPRQYQLPFCGWTLAVIRTLLKRKFGVELSKSGVSRLLRHLGLSPQRPIFKSYKRDPKKMKEHLEKRFPGLQAKARRLGAVIYFVDEPVVRSDAHRGTTWGKIGQTPEVQDSGDGFSLKLSRAVSPRGDMRFQCFEGRMKRAALCVS